MTTFYQSDWKYETSEDTTISVLVASKSKGTIILKKDGTDEKMSIKYKAFSAGMAMEPPWQKASITGSSFDTPSGGEYVQCTSVFSDLYFPCHGWIASLGASSVFGKSRTIIFFGGVPFAYVRCWGEYHGTSIGAGTTWGMAGFSLDDW